MRPLLCLVMLGLTGCLTPHDYQVQASKRELAAAKRQHRYATLRAKQLERDIRERDLYRARRKRELLRAMPRPEKRDVIIAVFDLEDVDRRLDDDDARALSSYVATAILENTTDRIVPPDRLRAALHDEKTSSYRACYDEACQIELGRALAANRALEPSLVATGDGCLLGATLYDLRTETVRWSDSVRGSCALRDLFGGAEALARALAAHEREDER